MSQQPTKECRELDNIRSKEDNAAQQWDAETRRLRGEFSELMKQHSAAEASLKRAEATGQILPAVVGAMGSLTGRLFLGTIAEGLANVVGAVGVEQQKAELDKINAQLKSKRAELEEAEKKLHNAQANACSTREQMRRKNCYLDSGAK